MGQDGSGQMTLDQFAMFVRLLQREALVMQFNQCDAGGQGMLTSTDFAKFLVTKVVKSAVQWSLELGYIHRIERFSPHTSPAVRVFFVLIRDEKNGQIMSNIVIVRTPTGQHELGHTE